MPRTPPEARTACFTLINSLLAHRFGTLPHLDRKCNPIQYLARLALWYRKKRSIVVVMEGIGALQFHGRMVMLVNQHVASAAEIVAGFARERFA